MWCVCVHTCVAMVTEVSTRMVSEYKTKLQISEAENSRLEGLVRTWDGLVQLLLVGWEFLLDVVWLALSLYHRRLWRQFNFHNQSD